MSAIKYATLNSLTQSTVILAWSYMLLISIYSSNRYVLQLYTRCPIVARAWHILAAVLQYQYRILFAMFLSINLSILMLSKILEKDKFHSLNDSFSRFSKNCEFN